MNIAIHGEKELLVRLTSDLVRNGLKIDLEWEYKFWKDIYSCDSYLLVFDWVECASHNHDGGYAEKYTLTPSNYNEILNIIIERKDENSKSND